MAITNAALDERLRRADRAARPIPDGDVLGGIASRTRTEARRRSIRNRLIGGAAAVVLLGGLVVSAPAAADGLHWLVTSSPAAREMDAFIHGDGGTEIIEGSEFVDTSRLDLRDYIEHEYDLEIPLPLAPGLTREGLVDEVTARHTANPGITQEVVLRRDFEQIDFDAWLDAWIAANAAGDTAREAAAVAALRQAPSWPALVATDGGGVTYIMSRYVDEIAAGNADAAQELAQVDGTPAWDGADRANGPGSLYERFQDEYQAGAR